jgi:acyl transferase domain-containing protein
MSGTSNEQKELSTLKRAFLKIEEMQAKLDGMERAKREPLAVVGMACRFPGGANDPEAFWQLLREGKEAISEMPGDRWEMDAYFDPDPNKPGKIYTRWGAFLDQVDKFDPQFFGISPREAVKMDPQQRLLLEVSWEALENAGIAPDKLSGSRTGVFVGICTTDYLQLQVKQNDPAAFDAYYGSGVGHSIASGRLSYILGLQGPSISLDTACSSSLVAVHLASQSLRSGECRMALAGGVSVILSPENSISFCNSTMLAADAHCKTFADGADGFVRGEGCGIVVLKRLSDALADGDRILALVRGSAVNQDGPSSGLTAPNGPAQEQVIREALFNGGLQPADVSYVEAHGTGTSLGDPIEVGALGAVFHEGRPIDQPLIIGAVKTNVGHLEGAAGIAGLIKVVLALQHRQIPANLHFDKPNPFIAWNELPLQVPTKLMPWQPAGKTRVAGVSSFGFSGTNAHVVLEEALGGSDQLSVSSNQLAVISDQSKAVTDNCSLYREHCFERPRHVLALSAKSEGALIELTKRYENYLAVNPQDSLADICFTANAGRAHLSHRLAIIAESSDELRRKLGDCSAGKILPGVQRGQVVTEDQPKIAFLFTGQGSQYVGMGRRLYETQPAFRKAIDKCDELLRHHLNEPLLSALYPTSVNSNQLSVISDQSKAVTDNRSLNTDHLLDQTAYTQPALFAIEYALAELWRSWGITPSVVMGHSVGEYVAACIAGVFSLEDGLKLIAARGRLMQEMCEKGTMAAIFAEEGRVVDAISSHREDVSIAAINGSNNTVISGRSEVVEKLLEKFQSAGIKSKKLSVSHAFHSPMMAPMLEAFAKIAAEIKYSAPRLSLISNATGQIAKSEEIAQAGYWVRHVREAVRFSTSMQTLHDKGFEIFLEIGATPTLLGMGSKCLPEDFGMWLPSLRNGRDDWQQMLDSLATLYVHGAAVDWRGFDLDYSRRRLALPTYPFQRKRYWIAEGRAQRAEGTAPLTHYASRITPHPMLAQRISSPLLKDTLFETQFSLRDLPFIDDHRVFGMAVLPATGYLEMITAAAQEVLGPGNHALQDMDIREALILHADEIRTVQLALSPEDGGNFSFQVISFTPAEQNGKASWKVHATGKIQPGKSSSQNGKTLSVDLSELQQRCSQRVEMDAYYQRLYELGIQFGERFKGVQQLWRGDGEALGRIKLTPEASAEAGSFGIHPATLDACLQIFAAAAFDEAALATIRHIYMPMGLESFTLFRKAGNEIWSHVTVQPAEDEKQDTLTGSIRVFDQDGGLIAELQGLHVKRVEPEALQRSTRVNFDDWLYEVTWQPQTLPSPAALVVPDYLPAPSEIAVKVEPSAGQLAVAHGLSMYDEFLPQIEKLCAAYVLQAFQQLGWQMRLHERVSVASLSAQLGVVEPHHRLLGRLLAILHEEGILKPAGSGWEVCRLAELVNTQQHWEELAQKFPSGEAQLQLVRRGGENLAAALRGEADPLQILFPGGSFELADKLYQESPAAKVFNTLAQQAAAEAVKQLPEGRTIRVLEIGAGTGGTSAFVLPMFPAERTEYVFTDLSKLFMSKAEERLADYPFLRFQVLNIEQDPIAQGFEPHQFDLIIASNVLHATADLRRTFMHVKQLLAPEGMLMMLEGMHPQRWIDLTFGLTEGWWLFSDFDLRPSYPLMAQSPWLKFLQEMGFTNALTVPNENAGGALAEHAVILARGPKDVALQAATTTAPGTWLIFSDRGGIGKNLTELLRAKNQTVVTATADEKYAETGDGDYTLNPILQEDYKRFFHEAMAGCQAPCRGMIHLWSLDDIPSDNVSAGCIMDAQSRGVRSALYATQALVSISGTESPELWLITRGAQAAGTESNPLAVTHAPLWGFGKVVELEHPEVKCVRLDLPATNGAEISTHAVEEARTLFEEIFASNIETQIAYRQNQRYVARLVRCSKSEERRAKSEERRVKSEERKALSEKRETRSTLHASQSSLDDDRAVQLVVKQPGVLEGLELIPLTRRRPGPGEVEIHVHATGLNFRDVLNALGMRQDTDPLGGECAGTIVAVGEGVTEFKIGDEVIAMAMGCFSAFVIAQTALVVPKPSPLNFAEAASFPLAFLTAHYALHQIGKMKAGERLLIHAAAGGVGQAAVQLAQRAGMEIFATAGNAEKREYLKSLGIKRVMNSRTLDFAERIREATNGEGIDLVLNSLTGEVIPKSLSLLRQHGRFLEIGKSEIWQPEQVAAVNSDATYYAIDLAERLANDPVAMRPLFCELTELLSTGALKPLPLRAFDLAEATDAFRYMAQAKHIGKVVVTQEHEERRVKSEERGVGASHSTLHALRSTLIDSNATYLITGGLSGLGLLMAERLVERGAHHLALMGRSAPSDQAMNILSKLAETGAEIRIIQGDVAREDDLARAFAEIAHDMPPLRGVIHSAGTLADAALLQQDWPRFEKVMAAKVEGAWHLHRLTENLPLDFFVLFSSISAVLGSPGQANHAATNAFMDALAHHRRALGLPALSINWGVWSEIGAAARQSVDERVISQGMGSFSPQQGLQVFEQLLQSDATQVAVMPVDWPKFFSQFNSRREPVFLAVFAGEIQQSRPVATPKAGNGKLNFVQHLEQAPAKKRRNLLLEYVRDQAVKVLSLDSTQVFDDKQPLTSIGLDSLMAVELRNLLGSGLGLKRSLPATLVFDYPTIAALTDFLAKEVLKWEEGTAQKTQAPLPETNEPALLEKIEDLSDDEVDRLFAAKIGVN